MNPLILIIPPSSFLMDEKVFPSLGVLKVAAEVREKQHPVSVIDLSGVQDLESSLRGHIHQLPENGTVPIFGITATMPQMPQAAIISKMLREAFPQARQILGGPHVTLLQASSRQENRKQRYSRASKAIDELLAMFDVLVAGDGELAIWDAMFGEPHTIIDGDAIESPYFLKSDDLNAAPLPARDLIDIGSYKYQIDGVPTQSMIMQLGCPFSCSFCGGRRSPFLRKVRTRSTAAVLTEIRHLYDTYGTRGYMMLDDELNVNKEFETLLAGIIDLQQSLGVEFRLRGLIKSELLTEKQAALMYRAGFRQLLIGFESGSDRILKNMNKHATRADNTRCVALCKKNGIRVKALMSVGHPGESRESIEDTRQWLLEVQPADFDVTIITVYPGTPYYDDAIEHTPGIWTYRAPNGDALHAYEVDQMKDVNFYKGAPGAYQSFVFTDYLSRTELTELRDDVERDVRSRLGIPWPSAPAELQFEHSMGAR